jgi:hypothetical protein
MMRYADIPAKLSYEMLEFAPFRPQAHGLAKFRS